MVEGLTLTITWIKVRMIPVKWGKYRLDEYDCSGEKKYIFFTIPVETETRSKLDPKYDTTTESGEVSEVQVLEGENPPEAEGKYDIVESLDVSIIIATAVYWLFRVVKFAITKNPF